jgi:hypothetical protein
VTITLRIPRPYLVAILAAILCFLRHVRAGLPLAGPVPVPVLLLAAGLTVCAIGAAVAAWLVITGRPYRAPAPTWR